ncbi:MAG: hypothetical protein MMC23_000475 [Stictis urceolatum]|nr:hypothetical protein [Stictis urceolata]
MAPRHSAVPQMLRGRTSTTYEAINILLNTEDREEQDQLTRQWRDHKLEELNFMGIVGGLVCSTLSSTGNWPTVLPDDSEAPWPVRAFWFSGLILSYASVLSAAFQSIRLHRLSTHRDALHEIRKIMTSSSGKHDQGPAELKPRVVQVWAWQSSMIFLTAAVGCMIAGLFVLVWSSTGTYVGAGTWWDGYGQVSLAMVEGGRGRGDVVLTVDRLLLR